MGLVAGAVHQHRHAQQLDHLLDLRRMVDHRGFDGEAAAFIDQQLIVRLAVLAGEQDVAALHGGHRVVDVPAGGLQRRQPDGVQRIDGVEQRHRRGRGQIDVFDGLLQYHDVRVQPLRRFHFLRHHQIARVALHVDQRVAALIVIHRKAAGVDQLHGRFPGQSRQRRALGQRRPAQQRRQRRQQTDSDFLHRYLPDWIFHGGRGAPVRRNVVLRPPRPARRPPAHRPPAPRPRSRRSDRTP